MLRVSESLIDTLSENVKLESVRHCCLELILDVSDIDTACRLGHIHGHRVCCSKSCDDSLVVRCTAVDLERLGLLSTVVLHLCSLWLRLRLLRELNDCLLKILDESLLLSKCLVCLELNSCVEKLCSILVSTEFRLLEELEEVFSVGSLDLGLLVGGKLYLSILGERQRLFLKEIGHETDHLVV